MSTAPETAELTPELRERFAKYGLDSAHYTYAEWCAICPLTIEGQAGEDPR